MDIDENGAAFVLVDKKNKKGFEIIPDSGNFANKGRGDNAFSYFTLKNEKKDEGISDLVTIGPCCNTDFRQGPEKFIDNEKIDGEEIVF
jgi:hypothetical protein